MATSARVATGEGSRPNRAGKTKDQFGCNFNFDKFFRERAEGSNPLILAEVCQKLAVSRSGLTLWTRQAWYPLSFAKAVILEFAPSLMGEFEVTSRVKRMTWPFQVGERIVERAKRYDEARPGRKFTDVFEQPVHIDVTRLGQQPEGPRLVRSAPPITAAAQVAPPPSPPSDVEQLRDQLRTLRAQAAELRLENDLLLSIAGRVGAERDTLRAANGQLTERNDVLERENVELRTQCAKAESDARDWRALASGEIAAMPTVQREPGVVERVRGKLAQRAPSLLNELGALPNSAGSVS